MSRRKQTGGLPWLKPGLSSAGPSGLPARVRTTQGQGGCGRLWRKALPCLDPARLLGRGVFPRAPVRPSSAPLTQPRTGSGLVQGTPAPHAAGRVLGPRTDTLTPPAGASQATALLATHLSITSRRPCAGGCRDRESGAVPSLQWPRPGSCKQRMTGQQEEPQGGHMGVGGRESREGREVVPREGSSAD